MALSLRGRRKLHAILKDGYVVNENVQGNLYMSTPHVFRHAVEYPSCRWRNRVVAIQCRLLMNSEDSMKIQLEQKTKPEVAALITSVLKDVEVQIPTMAQ